MKLIKELLNTTINEIPSGWYDYDGWSIFAKQNSSFDNTISFCYKYDIRMTYLLVGNVLTYKHIMDYGEFITIKKFDKTPALWEVIDVLRKDIEKLFNKLKETL